MLQSHRVELHYRDGRVEVVRDLDTAQAIVRTHPDDGIQIWTVSSNDVGLGRVVDEDEA